MKGFLWRHKTLLFIWLVAFGFIGYFSYTLFFKSSGHENPYVLSNNSNQNNNSKPAETTPQLKHASLNQTAQDGNFEFTVTGENCGETTIGHNQYAMAEAESEFCRVIVKIKNTSASEASLPLKSQVYYSKGDDTALHADVEATQYAQEDQSDGYWYENIGTGETSSGDIVFDVSGGDIGRVVLHGSESTPGIEVNLE